MGGRELRPAAHLLFLLAQEKKAKECAPLAATPQLLLRGNLGRGMGGVGRRTHFAPLALRSDSCGQSDHEAAASYGAAATPPSPRPRRIQKGVEVHTGHRCARPWEPSPLPSPRGRGSKTGVRRMVVGPCPCPCPCPCLWLWLWLWLWLCLGLAWLGLAELGRRLVLALALARCCADQARRPVDAARLRSFTSRSR